MRIFGREPVAILATVEVALALVLNIADVSQTTIGYVMAVVTAGFGLIGAWATYDTMLTASVGLVKALFVLGAVWGLNLSDNVTTGIIMLVSTVLGLIYNRQATSPLNSGTFAVPTDGVSAAGVGRHEATDWQGDVA